VSGTKSILFFVSLCLAQNPPSSLSQYMCKGSLFSA